MTPGASAVDEAAKRVRRAREDAAVLLDITDLPLTELPRAIVDLPDLRELRACSYALESVPAWIAELSRLRALTLDGSSYHGVGLLLRQTPLAGVERIGALASLESLELPANRLATVPDSFATLTGLTVLSLPDNRLGAVPHFVGTLQRLSTLTLSFNRLSSLPESISALGGLVALDLTDNQLKSLPESIGALDMLTTLVVPHNRLTDVPESIGALRELAILDLADNQLTALPDSIGALTKLTNLDLADNALCSVPASIGTLNTLTVLDLAGNGLTSVPESVGNLTALTTLDLTDNQLVSLPESIAELTALTTLHLSDNLLTSLPEPVSALSALTGLNLTANPLPLLPAWIGRLNQLRTLRLDHIGLQRLPGGILELTSLETLDLAHNALVDLPEELSGLRSLRSLSLRGNRLGALPKSLGSLPALQELDIRDNLLPPEVSGAAEDGTQELLRFLGEVARDGVYIREAKLILVGEGEVGKSTLLSALRGEPWQEDRDTTHGIEVKPLRLTGAAGGDEIILNGWDFGGQPVYRPTHQLFFSEPAVYLVVWKPRLGPELGHVEYWLRSIRNRAGAGARTIVVATHASNGPAPHLDEGRLRERFGDMIVGFLHVDSRTGQEMDRLRAMVTAVAEQVPHLGGWYPQSWLKVRHALRKQRIPYLDYASYERFAAEQGLPAQSARGLAMNSHALGHWVYYSDVPGLDEIVVFSGEWLSTSLASVLDDRRTVEQEGLLPHSRLSHIWDDPTRPAEQRHPHRVQEMLLALMERFELSYRVEDHNATEPVSLVAQLVRTTRPDLAAVWDDYRPDTELTQVCELSADPNGKPDVPEGLIFRLIVRFHRYSLGRSDHARTMHWAGGIILQNRYDSRAMVTLSQDRIVVRVRGAYPEAFLHQLVADITDYVEAFWPGLRTRVLVPCRTGCGLDRPGTGLFEITKLLDSRDRGRPEFPCTAPRCETWHSIGELLSGVEDRRQPIETRLAAMLDETSARMVDEVGDLMNRHLGRAENRLRVLLEAVTDEARDGPRLFTLTPTSRSARNPGWAVQRMTLTLWDEHSRLPLWVLEPERPRLGVYDVEVPRAWWVAAAPWLRVASAALRTLLPVGFDIADIHLEEAERKAVEQQLTLAEDTGKAVADVGAQIDVDDPQMPGTTGQRPVRAEDGVHRMLHKLLQDKDPTYGGLVRVLDPASGRYRWVHPRFVAIYRPPLPAIPG